jgi:hypothetical protein
MMGAGGVESAHQQQLLTDQYNKWATEQAYNNPWLQYLGTALGGTQAFQPVRIQQSGWGDALGAALGMLAGTETGAGMLGSLASGLLSML